MAMIKHTHVGVAQILLSIQKWCAQMPNTANTAEVANAVQIFQASEREVNFTLSSESSIPLIVSTTCDPFSMRKIDSMP